jgi:hypothetical protein
MKKIGKKKEWCETGESRNPRLAVDEPRPQAYLLIERLQWVRVLIGESSLWSAWYSPARCQRGLLFPSVGDVIVEGQPYIFRCRASSIPAVVTS